MFFLRLSIELISWLQGNPSAFNDPDRFEEKGVVSSSSLHHRTNPINRLPDELILEVLQYLNAKELCALNLVCRQVNHLANSDRLWKVLCRKHSPPINLIPPLNEKQSYRKVMEEKIKQRLLKVHAEDQAMDELTVFLGDLLTIL